MEKSAKKKETIPQKNSKSGGRGFFALMSAFTLAVLLAGALAEKFARQDIVHRADWIMFFAAAAIAGILLGVMMASRTKPVALGEGEITVFDLGLDDPAGFNGTNKPAKSIGTLAESIRQTANEIAMITEQLAAAHASGPTSEKSPGSAMRSIVDSEADTLAQLDITTSEAALLAEETSALNELIGGGLVLAEIHARQGAEHAKALESISGMSNRALVKVGEVVQQVRALERDRDALSSSSHEALSSLQEMLRAADETLLAFGDAAKNLDGEKFTTKNPVTQTHTETWITGDQTMESQRATSGGPAIDTIRQLNGNLSKLAEYIQTSRMNQRLNAGKGQESPKNGLEDAEALIRKTRDDAAMLELQINRQATSASRTIQEISTELAAVKHTHQELSAKGNRLSVIAGNMAHAMGQIRNEMQSEASRLKKFLTRSTLSGRQSESAMPDLMVSASQIAHNCNRLAIDSQLLQIDGAKITGKIEEIRMTSAANRGNLQRLQQATGASIAKVESVVKLVHGLVISEDSATRRSTANAATFSIQDKVAVIDRFALRVIEMENKLKRMRGPSPAMDRSEMEKLPEYEFPVH